MLIVLYAKIVDGKKNGLKMEGPFQGPEVKTMKEAHNACTKIVSASKDTVLVKIYDLDEYTYETAMAKANQSFEYSYGNMQEAAKIMERPIMKRKKKRYKPKPKTEKLNFGNKHDMKE